MLMCVLAFVIMHTACLLGGCEKLCEACVTPNIILFASTRAFAPKEMQYHNLFPEVSPQTLAYVLATVIMQTARLLGGYEKLCEVICLTL